MLTMIPPLRSEGVVGLQSPSSTYKGWDGITAKPRGTSSWPSFINVGLKMLSRAGSSIDTSRNIDLNELVSNGVS